MQVHKFLAATKTELFKRGVNRHETQSLIEEWEDHLHSHITRLTENGYSEDDARNEACSLIGKPEELASHASSQTRSSSWQGRNPWTSSFAYGLMILTIGLLIFSAFSYLQLVDIKPYQKARLASFAPSVSLLPWCVGMIWLIHHARKRPSGWKGLWIVSGWVSVVLSSTFLIIEPTTENISFGIGYIHYSKWFLMVFPFVLTLLIQYGRKFTRFQTN